MWGSKKRKFGSASGTTLVARDTTIVGDVHFSGCLEIEGIVQGNLVADEGSTGDVSVAENGRVEGEIRAPVVVIDGTVEGDVFSTERLELAPRGRVLGNVHYAMLEMAAGSEVNGSLTHSDAVSTPAAKQPDPFIEVTEMGADGVVQEVPSKAAKS